MLDSTDMAIPTDVFVALAAVAWADGRLDADEADALVRAAADEGLDLDALEAIERATREPPSLSSLASTKLTREERAYVYALAAWIAHLDATVTAGEARALATLGETLGVPERLRARAELVVAEVAALPDGDRPARYDLSEVRKRLGERLSFRDSGSAG